MATTTSERQQDILPAPQNNSTDDIDKDAEISDLPAVPPNDLEANKPFEMTDQTLVRRAEAGLQLAQAAKEVLYISSSLMFNLLSSISGFRHVKSSLC